jgi:ATP-dependent 26S proteasome regulatory subunit
MENKQIATPEQIKLMRLYKQAYYLKNKEKIKKKSKQHYIDNKDNISQKNKEKYLKNRDNTIQKVKNRYEQNKESYLKTQRKYKEDNKEVLSNKRKTYYVLNKTKISKKNSEYIKNRLKKDVVFKLRKNISSLIREAFKNSKVNKGSKTHQILGCSYDDFKKHIESLWQPWMNWDNYGNPKDGIFEPNKTWDIDHIIPLSTTKTEDDVIRLNHYTNLQPLCSYYNRFIKRNLL